MDEPSTETGDFSFLADAVAALLSSVDVGSTEQAAGDAGGSLPESPSQAQEITTGQDGEEEGSATFPVNPVVVELRQWRTPVAAAATGARASLPVTRLAGETPASIPVPEATAGPEKNGPVAVRANLPAASTRADLTFALRVAPREARAAEVHADATGGTAAAAAENIVRSAGQQPSSDERNIAGQLRAAGGTPQQRIPENRESSPAPPRPLREAAQPSEPACRASHPEAPPPNREPAAAAREHAGPALAKRRPDSPARGRAEANEATRVDALPLFVREARGATRSGQTGGDAQVPSRPVTETVPSTDPLPTAKPPVKEILLRVPADDGAAVDVRLLDKAGRLHVSVRTPAADLAMALRHDVGQLVARIDGQGYRTDSFVPDAPAQSSGESRDGRHAGGDAAGRERLGGDGSSGSHSGQDHPRDGRPKWLEELERYDHSSEGNRQEVTTWLRALRV